MEIATSSGFVLPKDYSSPACTILEVVELGAPREFVLQSPVRPGLTLYLM